MANVKIPLLVCRRVHWRRFRGGRRPLGSDTEGGEICLAPSIFCFFCLYLNLGAKFHIEIELLSLNKHLKKVSPPRNWLNQQKIDAYGRVDFSKSLGGPN